jgi:muconate cycloisomerase
MKITRIETIPVSVPFDPARMITGARGPHDRSPFLLVRIHTDEGLVGLGEASCTPRWSGEDSVIAAHVIATYLAPRLVGEDPCAPERLSATADAAITGHRFAKASIEMALWDLAGKAAGLPVYRLLGGPTRDKIRTKFSISGADTQRAVEIAEWAAAQGFTAMKAKVATGMLAHDLARVGRIRDAVGSDATLGIDANGRWDRASATVALERLEEHDVSFAEQPMHPRDAVGMAALRRRSRIPIVADDGMGTSEDALDLVRANAADVLSLYVGMAGGIAPARRAAAVALAAGIGWTIGSNLELGVGLAAHIHLAASTLGLCDDLVPCDIISPFYYESVLLAEQLPIEAGWVSLPQRPGLGVELDDEAVARYREDGR